MKIVVVIPCFKVKGKILGVIESIGFEVQNIYVVDDACPENSGRWVEENSQDQRVSVIYLPQNLGVGGAVMAGYRAAIGDGADIMVKIDGDGQMDPTLLPHFVAPIQNGVADYTKGNRFFDVESVRAMPGVRLFGNAVLSMLNKLSSGYWDIFDPTNGYTAIRASVASRLPLNKVSKRYFFESDLLFRLNLVRAVVADVPMVAVYADEVSNLKISRIIHDFAIKHSRNFIKRIFYNYFLRDMSIASLELLCGLAFLTFGVGYGAFRWAESLSFGGVATAGTVMLSALPVILGIQLLLAFFAYDISSVPRRAFSSRVLQPGRED